MKYSYVIVGSGLTGAVIARLLVDAGETVLVVERRSRLGGNVADAHHPSGIRLHLYGPHVFRTSSAAIWKFVSHFSAFHSYRHQIKSLVEGHLENWPIAASCIRRLCGEGWKPARKGNGPPDNFEEAALAQMPRLVYDKFVKGYTEKQWGVPARSLSADLCKRFDIRADDNPFLHPRHQHQGIPTEGYSRMVERILEGVPVVLNCDYLENRDLFKPWKLLVFTGPIDEYFRFELGKLAYRGQRRVHAYHADVEWLQPCAQVNEPGALPHIRDIEWKHLMHSDYADRIRGSVMTRETPWSPTHPDGYEYPLLDVANQHLYHSYRTMAAAEPGVLICGRLGEYRYYDMDHAIGRAMTVARGVLTTRLTY